MCSCNYFLFEASRVKPSLQYFGKYNNKKTFRTEGVQGTCMVVVCDNKSMFSELASSLLKINDFQNMYAEL